MKNTLFCSSLLLALASSSQGDVTITNQWRLGGGSSALADDIGGATLTAHATPVSAAGIAPGSTSSQDFQNTVGNGAAAQYMTATATIGVTSNWGVSVWVHADSLDSAYESEFLKIGGLNLQTIGGNWTVHEQGVWLTTISSPAGTVATGVDYQVSYVNQNGFASLYVNGVNLGDVHAINSGNDVLVGAQEYFGKVKGWDGRIDEITLFTFAEGEFVDADLDTFALAQTPLEAWRFTNFGDARNTGIGADSEDPDGDGQNNLAEYTAGTDPNNGQDFFRVISTSRVDGSFAVTTSGKSGRKYVLEQSPTLVEGTWTSVTTLGPLASDAIIELTDPAPVGNTNFYRIRVEFP